MGTCYLKRFDNNRVVMFSKKLADLKLNNNSTVGLFSEKYILRSILSYLARIILNKFI